MHYHAGHAFACDERASYEPKIAALAWERSTEWLVAAFNQAEGRWIGLSLIQGAGRPSFYSREGRFRNTAPVFFGDIHAAQFNVRFRAPFGHRRIAR